MTDEEYYRYWNTNAEIARQLGWTEVYGGPPHGVFWRGTPPGYSRVMEVPDYIKFIKHHTTSQHEPQHRTSPSSEPVLPQSAAGRTPQ